jgi:hypothetical protein
LHHNVNWLSELQRLLELQLHSSVPKGWFK